MKPWQPATLKGANSDSHCEKDKLKGFPFSPNFLNIKS
jgi:hypothetical protein